MWSQWRHSGKSKFSGKLPLSIPPICPSTGRSQANVITCRAWWSNAENYSTVWMAWRYHMLEPFVERWKRLDVVFSVFSNFRMLTLHTIALPLPNVTTHPTPYKSHVLRNDRPGRRKGCIGSNAWAFNDNIIAPSSMDDAPLITSCCKSVSKGCSQDNSFELKSIARDILQSEIYFGSKTASITKMSDLASSNQNGSQTKFLRLSARNAGCYGITWRARSRTCCSFTRVSTSFGVNRRSATSASVTRAGGLFGSYRLAMRRNTRQMLGWWCYFSTACTIYRWMSLADSQRLEWNGISSCVLLGTFGTLLA